MVLSHCTMASVKNILLCIGIQIKLWTFFMSFMQQVSHGRTWRQSRLYRTHEEEFHTKYRNTELLKICKCQLLDSTQIVQQLHIDHDRYLSEHIFMTRYILNLAWWYPQCTRVGCLCSVILLNTSTTCRFVYCAVYGLRETDCVCNMKDSTPWIWIMLRVTLGHQVSSPPWAVRTLTQTQCIQHLGRGLATFDHILQQPTQAQNGGPA